MAYSVEELYRLYLECSGVCTDSRKILTDSLFICLKGPNFNANQFAEEALDKGAKYAVVDDPDHAGHPNCYLVDDSLRTLQQLARHHRRQLTIPVIGITGSNGKTTTKELVAEVLKTSYQVYFTQGNLNNHIGVPLTVLSISREVEIAVVEMGANHVGEIDDLCGIAMPTHGLITNIGRAHMEGFGGFDGVIRGKSELYQYLLDNQGKVFVNSQDKILSNMAKRLDSPIYYPAKGDFLNIHYLGNDPFLKFTGESGEQVTTHLIGAYNFFNLAAALCIGKFFKVPDQLAETAVADYLPVNNRSQVIQKGTNTIVLDAYNANPSSMKAALDNLFSMKAQNKVAILGDMMELGQETKSAHRGIVHLAEQGVSRLYLVGKHMGQVHWDNPAIRHFPDRKQLISYLHDHPITGSTILIKASRSMGLEEIVQSL